MRFLIDAQLPPGLCGWLEERGHEAVHVAALAGRPLSDLEIARHAETEAAVLISKDDDFVQLRLPDRFVFLWLRSGNISKAGLTFWLERRWREVEGRLDNGAKFIELR